jgi:adenylate cyclase
MATHQEILDKVDEYLNEAYVQEDARTVPKRTDLTFGNTVKKIGHTVVLYVDMRKSRRILSDASNFWSVKVHRAFLLALTHCVEYRDGHMRSFNGDGILAFFVGENAASRGVRAAMDTKAFVLQINEHLNAEGVDPIDFGIGIAQGGILVAKSGKSGDDWTKQDLVWIGLPIYLAVELSEFGQQPNNIWISNNVRTSIGKENHLGVVNDKAGNSIWTKEAKKLKSVGEKEVRTTTWYSVIV